jgi:hypothetical protein
MQSAVWTLNKAMSAIEAMYSRPHWTIVGEEFAYHPFLVLVTIGWLNASGLISKFVRRGLRLGILPVQQLKKGVRSGQPTG